jgi:hypothetical protein
VFPGQNRKFVFPFGQDEVSTCVSLPGGFGAARLGEPVRGVLAHRFQQPVAGLVLGWLGGHQRFGREPVDHL